MIQRFIYTIITIILLSTSVLASSSKIEQDSLKRKWYIPRAAKIQYAGNIGFMALGATYNLVDDWYQISLMYGITSSHSEADRLNTIALKNTFSIKKFHYKKFTFSPTAGLSINLASTHNTYRKFPDHFPDQYYFQNKIHFAPFVGGMVYHPLPNKTIKGIDFYFELGTMDNYLLESIRTDYVKFHDIWNLALGMSFYF